MLLALIRAARVKTPLLFRELPQHRLIVVTNVSNPEPGDCAKYYRFLWHPWMQNERDASFVLAAPESERLEAAAESPDDCEAGEPNWIPT
jgi:hypothetical protein